MILRIFVDKIYRKTHHIVEKIADTWLFFARLQELQLIATR